MRVLVACVLLVACGHPDVTTRVPPKPTAGTFRVMSYNVNFGLAGDRDGVAAVAEANADVVFLQETNDRWEAAFVDALATQFPHHRFTPPKDWPAGGMGVLSRFPIASIDQLDSYGGFFFAWRVVLDTPDGKLQVLNVHLRPPISDGGSWVVGYFSTRGDREREITYHHAALDPELPTIVVGDFNEQHDGLAIKFLEDRGFDDAIHTTLAETPTWSWPVGSTTLHLQLDHVLHDAHFIVHAAHIVHAGRSDHEPVWVDFERREP